ncbi:MAG: hypothetical protein ACKOF3_05730 [Spartobacteria bacterium]
MLHSNCDDYADKTRSDLVRNSSTLDLLEETLKGLAKAGKSLRQHPDHQNASSGLDR